MMVKLCKVYLGAALLALPMFVILMWLSPLFTYEFFCKGGDSCFREWVGSLSGYFALTAALLTVREMAAQRKVMIATQRENIELAITQHRATARRYLRTLRHVQALQRHLAYAPLFNGEHYFGPALHSDRAFEAAISDLWRIQTKLESTEVRNYEAEIGSWGVADDVCAAIRETRDIVSHALDAERDSKMTTAESVEMISGPAFLIVTRIRAYLTANINGSEEFIRRWSSRVADQTKSEN